MVSNKSIYGKGILAILFLPTVNPSTTCVVPFDLRVLFFIHGSLFTIHLVFLDLIFIFLYFLGSSPPLYQSSNIQHAFAFSQSNRHVFSAAFDLFLLEPCFPSPSPAKQDVTGGRI